MGGLGYFINSVVFSLTEGLLSRGFNEIGFSLISLCTLKFDNFAITIYYCFCTQFVFKSLSIVS